MMNHWLRGLGLARVLRMAFFFIALTGVTFQIACSQKGSDADNSQTSSSQTTSAATAVVPLRVTNVDPSSAVSGAEVTVTYTGQDAAAAAAGVIAESSSTPQVILAGKALATNLVAGAEGKLKFVVPDGVTSAPLYIRQGDRKSNAVWFSVSDISVVTPEPEDVVLDELGNEVAVNLVVVSIKDGYEVSAEAQRIADAFGAKIVGKIPLINGYQLRVSATTLEELKTEITTIETDPAVAFVMADILLKSDATFGQDWTEDPGVYFQRENNRVVQGADVYKKLVHPTEVGKERPLFVPLAIVDPQGSVAFDSLDFNGYGEGAKRWNNIALHADDAWLLGTSSHGNTVAGVVCAGVGTGGNAGFLQAISGYHGGFDVSVEGPSYSDSVSIIKGEYPWSHGLIAASERMLKTGARVLNWSFGTVKSGSFANDGKEVTKDVRSGFWFTRIEKSFEEFLKGVEKDYPKVVIVAAAGNQSTAVDNTVPAKIQNTSMLVVGAHTVSSDAPIRSTFSQYGNRVDITAAGAVMGSDGKIEQGTSFAAPLVTATIAAMLSIDSDLTPSEIRSILRKSALYLDPRVFNQDGVVIDNVTAPLSSLELGADHPWIGFSARLNVEGAIQTVVDRVKSKTVPKGEEIYVTLGTGDVIRTVSYTAPDSVVFDKVDILFLVDVSGSYGDDLAQFKSQALALVDTFKAGGANVQIGVASFSDFPISPYGGSGDYAYQLHQELTVDSTLVTNAINGLTLKYGSDGPESQLEGLYQAATGAGRVVAGVPAADIAAKSVGWRTGALPIIFLATDASFHNSDTETTYPGAGRTQTLAALNGKKIRVYGLQAGGTITDVVNIANATGGAAFTLSSNSSEIKTAVDSALKSANASVSVRLRKDSDPAGLVKAISPDIHLDVTPGETVQFDVTFSREKIEAGVDYVFGFRLEVLADDVAVVQEIPVIVQIK